MFSRWIVAAALAVPLLPATAQQQAVGTPAVTAKGGPAASPVAQDRIDRIRRALLSQIAVYDQAEQAMRRPTEAEAAALTGTAEPSAAAVPLPGGGLALRRDLSSASFLIVDVDAHGNKTMRHGGAHVTSQPAKGGQHAH